MSRDARDVLLDGLADAVLATDVQGNLLYVNRSARRLCGLPRDGLDGTLISDLAEFSSLRERIDAVLERASAANGRSSSEKVLGYHGWGFLSARVLSGRGDSPATTILWRSRPEVTEEEAGEESIRELVEHLREILWLGSPDWNKIYYISPAYEEIWGRSRESLYREPRSWLDSVHPEDRAAIESDLERKSRGDLTGASPDYRIIRPDGTIRWVRAKAFPICRGGRVRRIAGVVEDITSFQEALEALTDRTEYLRNLADSLADAVLTVRIRERVIDFANEAVERIFGFSRDDVIGQTTRMFYRDDETYRAYGQLVVEALTTGQQQIRSELELCTIKGQSIQAEVTTRFRIMDGEPRQAISIIRDVTQQRLMEDDLRRIQNLESLGVLAGGIAHDFNNILTGVLTNLELLELSSDVAPPARAIAREARQAAERSRGLTHQLLTFARGGTPRREVVRMEDIVRDTLDLSLHGSRTRVELGVSAELPPVSVDPGQIGQVLQNLILNADQAMPGGGTLRVEIDRFQVSEGDPIPVAPGPYVRVTLSDEGGGIPKELLNRIFDPYFSTREQGHGLGLAISHSVVKRHEGYIGVQSTAGVGTSFEIYLPASLETLPKKGPADVELVEGSGRVLLVDDHDIVHRVVTRSLEKLGYEVAGGSSGAEALAAFVEAQRSGHGFDLVLTDLTIPGEKGGSEVLREVRAIDPRVPVIVTSGYSDDPVLADPRKHGFDAALEKPVVLSELAATVRRVLGEAALRGGAGSSIETGDRQRRVLSVDDEPLTRDALERILIKRGYELATAASGEEALELYRARPGQFDAVVLDYSLPAMNGADVLTELKALEPALPVVMTSGYGRSRELAHLESRFGVVVLAKPFRIDTLVETLEALLVEVP